MNTNSFFYKNLEVTHIVKKSLKNSYINIDAEANVTLKTPVLSQKELYDILESKETWIRKKIALISENTPPQVSLGENILLFNDLVSIENFQINSLKNRLVSLRIESNENITKCYHVFYKEYAVEYIEPRVEYFSKLMGLEYNSITFRKMKRRWGSCNSKRVLTFNTQLMKIKKELIDYVIVHELAHLKHMNHSKSFHSLVDKYLPTSKLCIKELRNIKI